jgi:Kelch motif
MTKKIILSLTFTTLFILARISSAQTLTPLVHQSPGGANLAFQLTDGTVMCQADSSNDWYKLTPDNTGSYINGTWTQLASLQSGYVPDDFASAVLADGRVVITGGEYNNGQFALTNLGAVYDPIANTWTPLAAPPGWDFIGDSPSVVLPDGRFVVGRKLDMQVAALDPATLTWTLLGNVGKSDFNAEEGWTLLPDGTVLTFDVQNAPNSEIYNSSTQTWQSAGSTIVDLHSPSPFGCIPYGPNGQFCYYPPGEVGPGILLADGRVFCTGSYSTDGPGHTALYTPSTATWIVGPDFPNGDNAGDSFAALLPNGNALVEGVSGTLYEFDGTHLNPTLSAFGALMVLPTGQVLVSSSTFAQVYTPANTKFPSKWAPTIQQFPATVMLGSTYQISGQQFNGLSQAASFGDELETATNYPLVRITNNATGHVFYARTHGHSTMGVATGGEKVSTNFDVPAAAETGSSSLEVVANGIASEPVTITVNTPTATPTATPTSTPRPTPTPRLAPTPRPRPTAAPRP